MAAATVSQARVTSGDRLSLAALILMAGVLFGAASASADFVPGRIYIPARAQGACTFPGAPYERLYEFDPLTGQHRIFLEFAYPPCSGLNGMTFTPDGTKLRASIGVLSQIDEIDGNGAITTALNAGNGIAGPGGHNNVAYDKFGNFFVVNNLTKNIMKYPAGGGPGVQFAGILPNLQGVLGAGAIDNAPDGGLYYAYDSWHTLARYSKDGEYSEFDKFPNDYAIRSVAVDSQENVFILTNAGIYRYDKGNPATRRLIAGPTFGSTLILSPDEQTLYSVSGGVYAVDPNTGLTETLGLLPATVNGWKMSYNGAAVAIPEPSLNVAWVGLFALVVSTLRRSP